MTYFCISKPNSHCHKVCQETLILQQNSLMISGRNSDMVKSQSKGLICDIMGEFYAGSECQSPALQQKILTL